MLSFCCKVVRTGHANQPLEPPPDGPREEGNYLVQSARWSRRAAKTQPQRQQPLHCFHWTENSARQVWPELPTLEALALSRASLFPDTRASMGLAWCPPVAGELSCHPAVGNSLSKKLRSMVHCNEVPRFKRAPWGWMNLIHLAAWSPIGCKPCRTHARIAQHCNNAGQDGVKFATMKRYVNTDRGNSSPSQNDHANVKRLGEIIT